MAATSAAICLWRRRDGDETTGRLPTCRNGQTIEILIVHPGGPYWAKKDAGAWSLPKGEYDPEHEDGLDAARREFHEEIGQAAPTGDALLLGQTKLKSGKLINAWALEGDLDADQIVSNMFMIEWPPRSGKQQQFPEVDRAMWADDATARDKLNAAQVVFLDRLLAEVSD